MKKTIAAIVLILPLAACTQTQQGAVIGAAGGAAVGAAVADDELEGALVGAAVGGAAGALIGNAQEPGQCIYQDQFGRRYTAPC